MLTILQMNNTLGLRDSTVYALDSTICSDKTTGIEGCAINEPPIREDKSVVYPLPLLPPGKHFFVSGLSNMTPRSSNCSSYASSNKQKGDIARIFRGTRGTKKERLRCTLWKVLCASCGYS